VAGVLRACVGAIACAGLLALAASPALADGTDQLRCSRGSWTGKPRSFTYRWVILHKSGTAGRGASLTLSPKLHGRTIECSVTAKRSAGTATATSRPFKIS
jgi:hypothetical protein